MRPRQTVAHVPIDRLTAHPANIRDDLGDLSEMARSIQEHGVLQPLTATEDREHDGMLLLLAGHRRLAAAVLARLDVLPVIIRHDLTDPAEHVVVMLVENTQRLDLNPIERAEAYEALRNRGLSVTEIARRTGSASSAISYYLRLLDLPEEERDEIRAGNRAVSSAIASVRAERQEQRIKEAGRPVGRPRGRRTTPYFSEKHPLAAAVRAICKHRGRPKVGGVGCGPCWEQAIREAVTPTRAELDSYEVDEAAVEQVLGGQWGRPCNPGEKREVARRWAAGGHSLAELERLTGWKPERYFLLNDEAAS